MIQFYGTRNRILYFYLNFPYPLFLGLVLREAIIIITRVGSGRGRKAAARGYFDALASLYRFSRFRKVVPFAVIKKYARMRKGATF
jgi:hypothetical protein